MTCLSVCKSSFKAVFLNRWFVAHLQTLRVYKLTTYAKKLLPKILTKLVCQKQPKAVQPAQPISQSCQKNELQKNIR